MITKWAQLMISVIYKLLPALLTGLPPARLTSGEKLIQIFFCWGGSRIVKNPGSSGHTLLLPPHRFILNSNSEFVG